MDDLLGAPSPDQVLSQSEVENLLAQVTAEENKVVVHTIANGKERRGTDSIQPYDFRHPVFLSQGELRRLRLRHEEFIRALAARLSLYLRIEFSLQMSKLQTVLYRRFTESLANPTCLTLFRAEPLPGACILEIQPRLALTIVDRLLGGPAHSVSADHDLSEIELALLDQAVQVILSEWCSHWRPIQELRPVVLGHETNGRFLQTAPHDTVMLSLSMEARIGDCMEPMQIAFPYYTLEPLIRTLSQMIESKAGPPPGNGDGKARWNPQFDDIRVPVTAQWQDLELAARDLAALKVGDMLEMSPSCLEKVDVQLAETSRFRGRLGKRGKHWA
ncbi:MAG: flagellar motor switch protein FliM, partial [Nitrospira sp.]|nr:flagellar motor switch protein FliM [Nitrospira sp.]